MPAVVLIARKLFVTWGGGHYSAHGDIIGILLICPAMILGLSLGVWLGLRFANTFR